MTDADHILIIDDDLILVEMLAAFFRQNGMNNCLAASNGVIAQQHLDQFGTAIKLITCDLNMPDCDGVEFLTHLQNINCSAPVLLITSASDAVAKSASTLASAYGLNFLGVLKKPIEFDQLTEIIAGLDPSKA